MNFYANVAIAAAAIVLVFVAFEMAGRWWRRLANKIAIAQLVEAFAQHGVKATNVKWQGPAISGQIERDGVTKGFGIILKAPLRSAELVDLAGYLVARSGLPNDAVCA